MKLSVAIVGPGAIGGTIAAWLAQNPNIEVTLCARTPLTSLRIETPDGVIEATPRVVLDTNDAEPVDWVLIATKTYDSEAASDWLIPLTGINTRVAVLQNGVEHVARFERYIAPSRIVPVIVDIPAERRGSGDIRQRRYGSLLTPQTENGAAFAELFAGTRIAASTTEDFITALWKKLCINCGGAIFALTRQPSGVARRDDIREAMHGLMEECAAVGRAEGANIDAAFVRNAVDRYRDGPTDSVNSILADRLAGRPMEIDARNGVVVRLGAKHGISAPLNALAVALLQAS
ncbi:MAG: 2-dehydropantoate 2-reductase [Hyphomonadaceae bacterium]